MSNRSAPVPPPSRSPCPSNDTYAQFREQAFSVERYRNQPSRDCAKLDESLDKLPNSHGSPSKILYTRTSLPLASLSGSVRPPSQHAHIPSPARTIAFSNRELSRTPSESRRSPVYSAVGQQTIGKWQWGSRGANGSPSSRNSMEASSASTSMSGREGIRPPLGPIGGESAGDAESDVDEYGIEEVQEQAAAPRMVDGDLFDNSSAPPLCGDSLGTSYSPHVSFASRYRRAVASLSQQNQHESRVVPMIVDAFALLALRTSTPSLGPSHVASSRHKYVRKRFNSDDDVGTSSESD